MMATKVRTIPASVQDSRPGRYPFWVKGLSFAAFFYAIIAFLNETLCQWYPGRLAPISFLRIPCCQPGPGGGLPFWLSHWTEYVIILIFGIWRTVAEKNPYTRKRLAVLTASVGVLWWLVPAYLRITEPYLGTLPQAPTFPSLHTPGTLTFFVVLLLVLLFGRRVICGWCCPCVGIRETVGFPFRINTLRSDRSRNVFRHGKWFLFIFYVVCFVLIVNSSPKLTGLYQSFLAVVTIFYFLSLPLSPLLGNRSYCRFVCPYGATFGILNKIGFFRIRMDQEKCIGCGLCEQVCDMGIPVSTQGRESGAVQTIEECMGCARCVVSCPKNALEIRDVRNFFHPGLRQDKEHLLRLDGKKKDLPPTTDSKKDSGRLPLLKSILLLSIIIVAVGTARYTPMKEYLTPARLNALIGSAGAWAPITFIIVYAIGVCLFVPGTLLTAAGATVFGPYFGFVYVWLGAMLGAAGAFLIGRYLGRDFAASLIGPRLRKYDEAIGRNGFATVLYLRLVYFPFTPMNFGMGLTKVGFSDYILGTGFGILVGTFIFTFFIGTLSQVWTSGHWSGLNGWQTYLSVSLFIFSFFLPKFIRKIRRAEQV